MEFVRWFIFIKIVSQAVKRLKKIVIIEKDCDNWEGLWLKKIVIIEKDCDNWKFSSNINEVIRAVWKLFIFFTKRFRTH